MLARALAAALALAVPAGAAHSGGAQLVVSVVVAKSARITAHGQPAQLQVTEADVARGYAELPPGVRLEVWSNSREGLMLALSSAHPFVWSEAIVVPGVSQRRVVELRGRLNLAPATTPGTYPWPVQVVATPL